MGLGIGFDDCMVSDYETGGVLYDRPCSNEYYGLCEIKYQTCWYLFVLCMNKLWEVTFLNSLFFHTKVNVNVFIQSLFRWINLFLRSNFWKMAM